MRNTILLLIFLVSSCNLSCQIKHDSSCISTYDGEIKALLYTQVDELPQYLGNDNILQYIHKNLVIPKQEEIQTKVLCMFVVGTNGKIVRITIPNKSKEEYTPLENQIVNLLASMGKWKSAKCAGKKVNFLYKLPITISYQE